MGDGLAFLQAQLLQHAVHAVRAEDAHQVVLQGKVELGAAGIALAAGPAAQLVVDAPALVALGAQHVEASGLERPLLLLRHVGQHLAGLALDLENVACSWARLGHLGRCRTAVGFDLTLEPLTQHAMLTWCWNLPPAPPSEAIRVQPVASKAISDHLLTHA